VVEAEKEKESSRGEEELKIAWRYKHQGQLGQESRAQHSFNASRAVNKDLLSKIETHAWLPDDQSESYHSGFTDERRAAFQRLQNVMQNGKFGLEKNVQERNLLRIAIPRVTSRLWSQHEDVERFLLALRAQLRARLSVAVLSCKRSDLKPSMLECVDFAIKLTPFDQNVKHLFKKQHGFLEFILARPPNLLARPSLPSKCTFACARSRISVERVHLPPDLMEQEEAKSKKNIDF